MLQQHLPLAVLKPLAENTYGSYATLVATTPTARGIETAIILLFHRPRYSLLLQQHLPLAVLKPISSGMSTLRCFQSVATTPTARGIETLFIAVTLAVFHPVATTPTARGIETYLEVLAPLFERLQQHLPLAVLKRIVFMINFLLS